MGNETCKEFAKLIYDNNIEEIKKVIEKNKEILSQKVINYLKKGCKIILIKKKVIIKY
jgi:hypothetical protein